MIKYKRCDALDVRISLNEKIYRFIWNFDESDEENEKTEIDDVYHFQ